MSFLHLFFMLLLHQISNRISYGKAIEEKRQTIAINALSVQNTGNKIPKSFRMASNRRGRSVSTEGPFFLQYREFWGNGAKSEVRRPRTMDYGLWAIVYGPILSLAHFRAISSCSSRVSSLLSNTTASSACLSGLNSRLLST